MRILWSIFAILACALFTLGASMAGAVATAQPAHATVAPKTAFQCEKAFRSGPARSKCFNHLPGASCSHPLEVQKTNPASRGATRYIGVNLREEPDGEGALQEWSWRPKMKNVAICPNGVVFKVSLLSQDVHCHKIAHGEEYCSSEYDTHNIREHTGPRGGGFRYHMTTAPVKSWFLVVRGYFIHPPWGRGR
jgi:hypothetical protein